MRDVRGDAVAEDERLALALLGRQADAGRDRGLHRPGAQPHAVDVTVPASLLRAPKTVSRISERPGADEPGEPDDLAGPHAEGDVRNSPRRDEALDAQQRLGIRHGFRRGGKTYSIERPVISRMISAVGRLLGRQPGGDGAAVLEHGDPVADRADLLEPVRDVDDGHALGGEVADDVEEPLHLAAVEHGGRLVHDDEPHVVRERAGHADDLLAGGAEACRPRGDGEISGWPRRSRSAAAASRRRGAGRSRSATSRGRGRCSRRR